MELKRGLGLIVAAFLLVSCQPTTDGPTGLTAVTGERIKAADSEPGAWMTHGRDYNEQRFSPLEKIDATTVKDLGLAWYFELGDNRGQEATPLIIDGMIYITGNWSRVYALDARSGDLKWSFDPEVPKDEGVKACCDVVNRGVAAWGDKLFVGTIDGRLIALDRATGKQVWSVITVDQTKPYTITGAPRVVKGKVIIGNGGAEYGVRGYVSAYDAETGKQAWRFYTVPGNPADGFENEAMARAAKTWNGNWWEYGGGGTVWDAIVYDQELDQLYIGVGNGSPWNHKIRSNGKGDNLYLSSVVALNPDTGAYIWHYQGTPAETWDYTHTQPIILADLPIDGKQRKVLMQAPKNGFFFVLDRTDGKLISAKNYVPTSWATGYDMATGRPIETANARYDTGVMVTAPGALGGHNWHPMAFSPKTGLVYIPAHELPFPYAHEKNFVFRPGLLNFGIDLVAGGIPDEAAQRKAIRAMLKGRLLAWDPVAQKARWSVEYKGPWNGGVLATAGNLVFQGTADARFVAYSADAGKALWSFPAQTGVMAGPVTYTIDGEQYVAVMAGWGGAYAISAAYVDRIAMPNTSRLLVFKLGGKATLPSLEQEVDPLPVLPDTQWPAEVVSKGKAGYYANCFGCHGEGAVSGLLPDLRYSAALVDADLWKGIVIDGALRDQGMIGFAKWLKPDDAEAIRAYVMGESRRLLGNVAAGKPAPAPTRGRDQ
jgi:quinohemoprotein ethanol dehydrogenase